MRIVGGKFRSRVLASFEGEDVRPTSDRAREALFNILYTRVVGARVLDLFAGSGAVGIECISRGAKEVVFNDLSKDSLAVVKKNLTALKIESGQAYVTQGDYLACLERATGAFDLIFIDPPYRLDYGKNALEKIAKKGLLTENGVAVYERDRPFEGEVDGLIKTDERKYGKAYLTFFGRA
jgi:16S rRNA (guanine(966)-N(2))-methyltransferase RsmD